ncbi:MAG: peptidylprolyl isomerase [Bacteroidales bacterium]|nr:peptidylprolyl isomerase [Bacteroidales bacterium]
MKKGILILSMVCLIAASGCKNTKNNIAEEAVPAADAVESNLPAEPLVDIVTNMGTIKVKLYEKTPAHRANFLKLAASNYYDSTLFHRVIKGFMIQGGDPLSKYPDKADMYGTGGPGYTIPAEFVNEYYHKKGALAAARKGDMANPKKSSSGSQFYIVQDEIGCLHLDGQYTIFGETVEGLDVIDRIAAVPTDDYDRPLTPVVVIKVAIDSTCLVKPAEPAAEPAAEPESEN